MNKIDYELYQVKEYGEHRNLLFSTKRLIDRLNLKIELCHYNKVYSGSISPKSSTHEVLESILIKFNMRLPNDYRGRSMSLSDVVVLNENGVKNAYFCDFRGYVHVPEFFQTSSLITMNSAGVFVDSHFGTWHTIDTKQIGNRDFYLMEHDEFGSEVASVIVDGTGKLVAEDVWNGFDQGIITMIIEEQGLHQVQAASVQEVTAQQKQLADTGSQLLQTRTDSPANYLAAAEGFSEENYNNIDGRIDTQTKLTPGDDTESHPEYQEEKRPSVLAKLKQNQARIPEPAKPDAENKKTKDNVDLG